MNPVFNYTIFPLGDAALTIDFGNSIDTSVNRKVLDLFYSFKRNPPAGVTECVPAYSSLTVYYDVWTIRQINSDNKTAFDIMAELVKRRLTDLEDNVAITSQLHRIPVCYDKEYGTDIQELAFVKKLSVQDVIHIHTAKTYMVYMLGFLPGFAYMGKVEEEISMPRKTNPRLNVLPGSVGIAGYQTGIYPLASPGGWQIIGRTPLQLFIPESETLTLLKPGDTVQFYSISKDEFNSY